ncbi:UNVERIFIED_CONTAM: Transcription factor GTE10 [Sesamum calycinum]|uniref:Transcription factor GTE10 n=1 Tax=Sesamum calycinum TaxID=2727403 RepID=A0AAW2SYD8_9LAMI
MYFWKKWPRTKGGPVAARRNESVKQGPPQSTSFVMVMKQCETLLTRLMAHQHAWIFNDPVDIVRHNIPDYFNVIKHPMDLGTVKSKVTFKSVFKSNGVCFGLRWKPIERKIPPTGDESTSKSSVIIEPESAYVPLQEAETVSMENKVNQERDKRAMTDVEKQKLGVELESLLAELPDNIVNFMKESTLNSSQVSEDEIEIDIDTLSDDTLFTLRKLLDDYLLEKQKKQAQLEPCEIEMQKESGFRNHSGCKDHEPADEYVDIGSDDPPPMSSSPPIKIDKDTGRKNSNCTSSRSSSSESGSSSTDSESSSASEVDGVKNSAPANVVNKTVDTRVERKDSCPGNPNVGDPLHGNAQDSSVANSYSIEPPNCRQEGESAPPERQVSPEKQYRAALLRSRFADIIIKAQENTLEKGGKPDTEKLKLEKEELERRRREEKARLQAEAKAAEEARRKAEVEAAAEARRKRNLKGKPLAKLCSRSAPDEHLHSFIEEASPENSLNGLGSFKFRANSNPLEQLGLYMKNDEEEEEVEPQSILDTSNDPEEGEID